MGYSNLSSFAVYLALTLPRVWTYTDDDLARRPHWHRHRQASFNILIQWMALSTKLNTFPFAAVQGFEESRESCDLGAAYSFSAFTLMAALLCLTLLILRLLHQSVKEYKKSPNVVWRCLKFVSIMLARLFIGLYVKYSF